MKLTQTEDKLAGNMAWVEDFSQGTVRLIGALGVLGVVGLLSPAPSGVLPWPTPLAAVGLVSTMVGAMPSWPTDGSSW